VHSTNKPVLSTGIYNANEAGDVVIRLYQINIPSTPTGFFANAFWYTNVQNITVGGVNWTYAVARYNDSEQQTTAITWNLYLDSHNGTLLFTNTVTNGDANDVTFIYNVTDYLNRSIFSSIIITHPDLSTHIVGNVIHSVTARVLAILSYFSVTATQWFFIILLGTIALLATIKTGNLMAIGIIALASVFILFGWFTLSTSTLAIALLVSLGSLLKQHERETQVIR